MTNSPSPQMQPGMDPTEQWLSSVLTLRTDLKFDTRHKSKAELTQVVIEDPLRSKFFQVGRKEYRFLASLDGVKSIQEVLTELQTTGQHQIDEEAAVKIAQWLVNSNLVMGDNPGNVKRLDQQAQQLSRQKLMGMLNPISFKIPLFNPNATLQKIQPLFGWVFSVWFFFVWCGVGLYTLRLMYREWDAIGEASIGILSGHQWLWLLVIWLVMKVIHETAHGLACRRYGGEVPEAGVLILLFTPMAFVNVTSSWRFKNRWHRIVVAGAGMYIELFVAFVALIIWSQVQTGVVSSLLFNIFMMGSATTILFNANPLMRFDGYFILSDILNVPNLYPKGTKWFGDRLKSLFFGVPKTADICASHEKRMVATYGSMAFFWKILISLSLAIGASVLFYGAGIALAAFGIALWFGIPIYRQLKTLFGPNAQHKVRMTRVAISCALVAALGISLFYVLKGPATKSAPAVVQFKDESVLRAGASGFIEEIKVKNGDTIKQGDVLLVLSSPELDHEVTKLQQLLIEAKIQSRIYQKTDELALASAEQKKVESLKTQLLEKEAEAAELKLKAPYDGFVFQRNLQDSLGSFVDRGDPILNLARKSTKEIIVSIDQRDIESVKDAEGSVIRVAIPGVRIFDSVLVQVNARATDKPTHPSLCANAGGPLAVRPVSGNENEEDSVLLLAPRISLDLQIEPEISAMLHSGQRGRAFFSAHKQSLGAYLYLEAQGWFEKKFNQALQTAVF